MATHTLTVEGFGAFEVEEGTKLVLGLEQNGVDVSHRCGGQAKCTTCNCKFLSEEPEMNETERGSLEEDGVLGDFRLSCQIRVDRQMHIEVLTLASVKGWEPGGGSRTLSAHSLTGLVNEDRLIQLFKDLVMINAPALAEREVVDWTKRYLQEIGIECWEDEAGTAIGGNANNLIALLPGNNPSAPKIYFSAHFDTVEPTAGLKIIERDGVFYSDGTTILGADDKGGMAPAIEALRILKDSDEPRGDIYLLLSCAEEIGLKGAAALKIEDLNLDFGYVLDTGPPVGTFVTRTATHDKLDITITGKPAHAGKDPEKGINAIQVAADAISKMKIGRIGPETTANLGVIEGGTATNVVCAQVRIWAEARSTNIEELDVQVNHMIAEFERAAREWKAEVSINHVRHYDAYHVPDDAAVVTKAQAASAALGWDPVLRTTLGGSDANVYNQKGVPSIVVATGMDKIHTHEELIARKDLVDLTKLCIQIALEVGKA